MLPQKYAQWFSLIPSVRIEAMNIEIERLTQVGLAKEKEFSELKIELSNQANESKACRENLDSARQEMASVLRTKDELDLR